MRKRVLRWELGGIVLIVLAGSALHFGFEWTGYWRPAALFAAVNESTWEHLKLSFWPGLVFALLEYGFIKGAIDNFWVAKSLGLFVMPVVTVVLFYGYTAILGRNYLALDILIFVLAVAAGQLASYRILMGAKMRSFAHRCAVIGLVVMVVAFSVLSYCPPRFFLFEDPVTGGYGILDSYGE